MINSLIFRSFIKFPLIALWCALLTGWSFGGPTVLYAQNADLPSSFTLTRISSQSSHITYFYGFLEKDSKALAILDNLRDQRVIDVDFPNQLSDSQNAFLYFDIPGDLIFKCRDPEKGCQQLGTGGGAGGINAFGGIANFNNPSFASGGGGGFAGSSSSSSSSSSTPPTVPPLGPPIDPPTPPIQTPEPATWLLLGSGILLGTWVKSRYLAPSENKID